MNNENTFEEMFAEFLRIYKFVNHSKIVEALNNELDDNSNNKKKIYELSDGNRSTRDIQKIVELVHQRLRVTGNSGHMPVL